MQPIYEHTQRGSILLGIFIVTILGLLILAVAQSGEAGALLLLAAVIAFLVAVMVTFSSLTVKVNSQQVQLVFGPGLVRCSFPVEQISGVRVVRNGIWMGLGIHFIRKGMIYNVSGLEGVEITLRNSRLARIGSDEPAALAQAVEEAMGRGRGG